jgi:hypothetical protein
MSDLPRLHSVAEVAEALGQPESFVMAKCRSKEWPHTRGSRGRVGFTDQHYAAVLELMSVQPADRPAPRMAFAPRSRRAS